MDISRPPLTTSMRKTSVMQIEGEKGDIYQVAALLIPSGSTSKALILLQDITEMRQRKLSLGIFFLLLDLAGFAALFLAA